MRSFFVLRVKKDIFRVVTLSINKAFIKPILAFWPFYTIKHLYVPGPCVFRLCTEEIPPKVGLCHIHSVAISEFPNQLTRN